MLSSARILALVCAEHQSNRSSPRSRPECTLPTFPSFRLGKSISALVDCCFYGVYAAAKQKNPLFINCTSNMQCTRTRVGEIFRVIGRELESENFIAKRMCNAGKGESTLTFVGPRSAAHEDIRFHLPDADWRPASPSYSLVQNGDTSKPHCADEVVQGLSGKL